ncbi:MAG TPA: NADH-quinone oxidoreductase subunit NuoG [Ktedonobacteraceae bacterium]|nr:NADH-quinone oxidoreductase subunit NuoG [Ktedonobacteraceae bacterium]
MAEEKKDELVHLTIDDIPVAVPPGTLVWAAAKQIGIEIPIYCYHPKMPPLGACRMCFVEIEKMPKPPQTACTTPVSEGMIVHTKTEKVLKARRGTLEFLLINHPLDCPICDKGGECDLQDFTLRHGPGGTRFDQYKRHYTKPIPISEDIQLDRERCILCQRCTRFSSEISMDNGLVMISRGYKMEVGTAPDRAFDSVFSGNTVEICPVGALTATSYRFKARPWELKHTPSVCNNCSVGCNARIDVRVDKIMRLMSRQNDEIDDGWLCNRGRWDFEYVNENRLRTPLIRRNGQLQPAGWDEALFYISNHLSEILKTHGPQSIAGIGSTRVTNEESYLFQKLLREVLGTPNIDHHHGTFPGIRDTLTGRPWMMSNSIAEIEQASHIVLIAADPYTRQPILDLRIKKAMRQGARIYVVNAQETELDRFAANKITIPEHGTGMAAKLLLQAALRHENVDASQYSDLSAELEAQQKDLKAAEETFGLETTTQLQFLANEIAGAKGAIILYDEMATLEPGCEHLAADVQALAVVTDNIGRAGAGAGPLFEDANSLGARDMGVLPDALPGYQTPMEPGLSYSEILSNPQIKALYVVGANPVRHLDKHVMLSASEASQLPSTIDFLIVQDITLTETAQQADVVLPAVSYAEKDGSMTNIDHHVQAVRRALRPLPGAKADWEIFVELARHMGHKWSYHNPQDVLREIGETNPLYAGLFWEALGQQGVRTQEQEVARA